MNRYVPALAMGILSTLTATAQIDSLDLFGQLRTRSELNSKSLTTDEDHLSTLMRTRFGVKAMPGPGVQIVVEAQDSRTMGTEGIYTSATPTDPANLAVLADEEGLDLHQGYFKVDMGPAWAAGGRQKLALGSQRVISSLEWHNNARVFDGLSAGFEHGMHSVMGLGLLVRDLFPNADGFHTFLSGLHYALSPMEALKVELYGFYEYSDPEILDLYTAGERLHGKYGIFEYEEEFILQWGEQPGVDHLAFYLATRLGLDFGKHGVTAGVDIMSGDNDGTLDGKNNTYMPRYYFAHAYFGWMDYFAQNPASGVIDVMLFSRHQLTPMAELRPAFHYFLPQNAPSGVRAGTFEYQSEPYGFEIDLELHLSLWAKSKIVIGGGLFLPQEGSKDLKTTGNSDEERGIFAYLMPTFNF